jgi:hypothetical protein
MERGLYNMSQLESKLCDSSPNSITFTTLCFYQILTCNPMIQALALLLATTLCFYQMFTCILIWMVKGKIKVKQHWTPYT